MWSSPAEEIREERPLWEEEMHFAEPLRPQTKDLPYPVSYKPKSNSTEEELPSIRSTTNYNIRPPNPYSLSVMNHEETHPPSPVPITLVEEAPLDPFEADQLELSHRRIDATTELLNKSTEDITYECKWQVGREKFLSGAAGTQLHVVGYLGHGSSGRVDEVRNAFPEHATAKTFARKEIRISPYKPTKQTELQTVQKEIDNLKRLVHPHIVKVIGSFHEVIRNSHFAYILTYPVGESLTYFMSTLKDIGDEDKMQSGLRRLWLRKWFGCLASALECMHRNNVQHKDIKPNNIIHVDEHIFFTDFSSSRNFESGKTSTERAAIDTRLYRAPESRDRHGNELDIFALGLVFVEMLTVLMGRTIEELHSNMYGVNGFAEAEGSREYWRIIAEFDDWFANGEARRMYSTCVKAMLNEKRKSRPSATMVRENILAQQQWKKTLACPCEH
ncbi:hypothetical protein N0V90_012365 [Kalmusia sp. IMI 367209]|nr:hypothetical protein N0V90_012365 [Kalmusia sp. IMI 367209]